MQNYESLFTDGYLKGAFGDEFDMYCATEDAAVLDRLRNWAKRDALKETSDEHGFIGTFFEGLWGYRTNGHAALFLGPDARPDWRPARRADY